MNLPDPKALKRLAEICRKAGIKSFKNAEFEFTLSDSVPTKPTRTKRKQMDTAPDESIISEDSLTQEQLLMWSTGDATDEALN